MSRVLSSSPGLLLRSFTKGGNNLNEVVDRAMQSIHCALKIDFFDKIVVVVPVGYDCGETAEKICEKIHEAFGINFYTVAVIQPSGHHSCEALNAGVESLYRSGCTHVTIVSNKAIEVMDKTVMNATMDLFKDGAKVVGVALNELFQCIISGRVQNTFATWRIATLREVGGFDSQTGVEEIAPTVRLVQKYGKCIGVVIPDDAPSLNVRKSKDGQDRHLEVMTTKLERQEAECSRFGVTFDDISKAVLPFCNLET